MSKAPIVDPRRTLTLRDVSEASGVSEMTVSRVLRGGQGFSDETREKVLKAAEAMAYVPNRLAQAFGRLIRSREDHGAFVVLSSAFPSRLLSAFPAGTPITRLTLDEALQRVSLRASGVTGQTASDAAGPIQTGHDTA